MTADGREDGDALGSSFAARTRVLMPRPRARAPPCADASTGAELRDTVPATTRTHLELGLMVARPPSESGPYQVPVIHRHVRQAAMALGEKPGLRLG